MPAGFLYPRTLSVRRPFVPATGSVGLEPYGGTSPATETVILPPGVQCAIQRDRMGIQSPTLLPTSSKLAFWKILIPAISAPFNTINKNDIIVDDLGIRYKVSIDYWTPLGYQLTCEEMES